MSYGYHHFRCSNSQLFGSYTKFSENHIFECAITMGECADIVLFHTISIAEDQMISELKLVVLCRERLRLRCGQKRLARR